MSSKETSISLFSLKRHQKFHHPICENQEVSPIPYLTLPFKGNTHYDITEGWMYSYAERKIHGHKIHGAIDIYVPYGTPVVAPCDGWTMSSYNSTWIKNKEGRIKKYQGRRVRFGLGYFVQIYNPLVNRFVQLGHFSEIDPAIPFSLPIHKEGDWLPRNHDLKIEEFKNNPKVVWVKKGQDLGRVGFSGLSWGYEDYQASARRPLILDYKKYQSYDEPHVHLEDFWRDQKTGRKGWQRDPYDVYLSWSRYPTLTRVRKMGTEVLFLLGQSGLPQLAA